MNILKTSLGVLFLDADDDGHPITHKHDSRQKHLLRATLRHLPVHVPWHLNSTPVVYFGVFFYC